MLFYLVIIMLFFLCKPLMAMQAERDSPATTQWNVPLYKENSSPQFAQAVSLIAEMGIARGARVLDAGCGTGSVTKCIENLVPDGSIIAIDNDPNMIAVARNDFGSAQRITFNVMDAQQISFKSQFDLITFFSSFHWMDNQADIMRRVVQALKPGGKVLMLTGKKHGPENHLFAALVTVAKELYPNIFSQMTDICNSLTLEELKALFIKNGLIINESMTRLQPRSMRFENRTAFANWIHAWIMGNKLIAQLSIPAREKLIETAIDRYLQEVPPLPTGHVTYNTEHLIGAALKPNVMD